MSICPYCGAENIEGADECSDCQQSLADLHLPEPATEVERALLRDRVSVLKPKAPVTVEASRPVIEVLQLLVDRKIGSVIIAEDGRAVGIFSERDALMKLNTEAANLGHRPVSDFMTPSPQTLGESVKLAFAVHRMDLGGFRHLPVIEEDDGERLIGVVSVRDILRYLTEKMRVADTV